MKKKVTDAGWAAHKLIESLEKRHDDEALEELHRIAHNSLESLQRLASGGNEIAAKVLVEALVKSIHQLLCDLPKQPDIFRKLARPNNIWPGFITVESGWEKSNEEAAKFLQLGEDAAFNYKGKQFDRSKPAVTAAVKLVKALEYQQRTRALILNQKIKTKSVPAKLPPFNRRTCVAWFDAAWPIFKRTYGNDFENHKDFAHHWSKAGEMSTKEQKKERGLVRREIKKALKQAFKSISPKVE